MVDLKQFSSGLLETSKDPERTWRELGQLAEVLAQVPLAKLILTDAATQRARERQRLIKQTVGNFSPLIQELVGLLAAEQALDQVAALTAQFEADLRRTRDLVAVTIESPAPLSRVQRASVLRTLPLGRRKPLAKEVVDPSLIGGVRVSIDDKLLDASLAGSLTNLEQQLTNA